MATAPARRRKFWGWGFEDQQPPHEQVVETGRAARAHLGFAPAEIERPVSIEDVELPRARLSPPPALQGICAQDPHERASHAYGKSYRDLIRAFRGRFDHAPDLVAHPRDEDDVRALLDWCADAGAAAIPFGGGTSVVGGVEAAVGASYAGAVAIDMRRLDRVLEVDAVSRAALIEAGASGPALEDGLRAQGLSLRFYPQSFEASTLGGWIATRAAGHFATLHTHIDDLVESVRAITPVGPWESRRLPGSGAGPGPDRLLLGSEGTLGVITRAWVRVQARPRWRASAGVRFASFAAGAGAVRELAQSGLWPSNCRLLDPGEARITGAASDGALLVLGFESAHHPLDAWIDRALECCGDHGGEVADAPRRSGPPAEGDGRSGEAGAAPPGSPRLAEGPARPDGGERSSAGADRWRSAFVQAPYLRDTMVAAGIISETFETAVTWDRLERFVEEVCARAAIALETECGAGTVTCRLTHAYPDGAAPYFTVLAPARRGSELEQWAAVKEAASEAITDCGGTITHHHAVGREHRPWYDRQRPDPFAAALRAAKRTVDPAGVLNPGVLVDPQAGAGG